MDAKNGPAATAGLLIGMGIECLRLVRAGDVATKRDGEIDARITAVRPLCFTAQAPNVGRLFPDYRKAEEAYYRKQGTVEEIFAPGLTEARWDTGHSP